ncbi:hypothetical protein FDJ32_gp17 [Pseudomonas phage NV1]|uniref:Uncharacterized protein n=1 Tax=Pseudomonas phage NV1 TaxID=2079543 RepID=A0A2L0HPM4_9CAUD|nr:hypothetical protein FDJ32_gp17 [Pseudomonas phage NV1]AUX83646.1 hypothetical protein NV1_p17 [Pseudomonas phage NV1]
MNQHPLTEDMRMYYAGTYIFRHGSEGEVQCMMVNGTERIGDDTKFDGFRFVGDIHTAEKSLPDVWTFRGDELLDWRPFSGYYDVDGKGKRYITFSVNNRTQRKGVDPRNIVVNGRQNNLNCKIMCKVFEQSLTMCSNPASRDLWVNDGKVHWKGNQVGTLDKEGVFTPGEHHKQIEEFVCRLLQNT